MVPSFHATTGSACRSQPVLGRRFILHLIMCAWQVSLNMVRRNPICRLGYRSGEPGFETLGAEGEPHAPA